MGVNSFYKDEVVSPNPQPGGSGYLSLAPYLKRVSCGWSSQQLGCAGVVFNSLIHANLLPSKRMCLQQGGGTVEEHPMINEDGALVE